MNITYIFKHLLPRKAKDKENKLFAKTLLVGYVGRYKLAFFTSSFGEDN